jgi:glucose-1-phosphate thymidylyltransferase
MKVIILAAGYATRLYPLTKDKPKALLPIGQKPLLDHLMDKIQEIEENPQVILVTNSRFYGQFSQWGKDRSVAVVDDGTTSNENRLGAIGDLQFALQAQHVNEDILMLASDNLFDGSLDAFVKFARSKSNAACVGVYDIEDPKIGSKRYGILEIDSQKRIVHIEEKPEHPKTTFVSMGIYYFSGKSLSLITEYLKSPDKKDAPGFYITWLLKRMSVYAFQFKERWYDIGSLEQLKEASESFKRR